MKPFLLDFFLKKVAIIKDYNRAVNTQNGNLRYFSIHLD